MVSETSVNAGIERLRILLIDEQKKESTIKHYLSVVQRYHDEHAELSTEGAREFLREHSFNPLYRSALSRYAEALGTSIDLPRTKKQYRALPEPYKEHELAALRKGVDDDYRLAIDLLIETGVRIGELVTMKWRYIDFDTGEIRLPTTKSRPRIVYPSPETLKRLESHYGSLAATGEAGSGWVFPTRGGSASGHIHPNTIRYHLKQVLDHAKPHTFRHTYATKILSETGDLVTTRDLLGHSDISTTAIYTHIVRPKAKAAASAAWQARAERIEEETTPVVPMERDGPAVVASRDEAVDKKAPPTTPATRARQSRKELSLPAARQDSTQRPRRQKKKSRRHLF